MGAEVLGLLSQWKSLLPSLILLVCLFIALKVLDLLWWRPRRVEGHFARQGIKGPPYRFFLGNVREMVRLMLEASSKPMVPPYSHNIVPRVLSFYHHWKKVYGSNFLLWFGPTARLTVADPDLIREIFVSRSEFFERYDLRGEKWAHHRKVITPTFHMENLKRGGHAGEVVGHVVHRRGRGGRFEWFQSVTEDAITRAAFGQSYDDGKAVFHLQGQQMAFAAEAFRNIFIPATGSEEVPAAAYRPPQGQRRRRRIDGDGKPGGGAKDMLGLLMNASAAASAKKTAASPAAAADRRGPPSPTVITLHDIVEECKTFFFAGKQTTSNLLTWATVLLAMHPEWQDLARHEVLRLCGSRDIPTRDHVAKLKTLGMVLNETLRLYPPAVATIRTAKVDVELGGCHVPRGTELMIPILAVHHDARLWGPDVAQFNPGRFADGVARAARHPTAFIPFGLGARTCIGQNLALLEAKITLTVLLQRYSFRLSPSYVHAPTVLMLLYPQYGAPVIFRPLAEHHRQVPAAAPPCFS
ncbi:unnamed protein product [Spirodela intermedia]|uniref:Uncharacterized protein n=1 Tax=Spirodela intermedia TaxID=51605 RepID=A0A7I8J805_SPIIN|nr:unnamed protein product [Spirodela intermedia]CAA6666358.1 unnamed protein product [Spirodela intermedia]